MRKKLLSITQSLRLPSICQLCNQFHKGTLAVCSLCIDLIPSIGPSCQHCAYPLPDSHHLICGTCIKKIPYFDRAFIAYTFEEPLRSMLHDFKYNNGLFLGSFLSHLMIQALPNTPILSQCLIPVPMHPKKIKQRGFNQAVILAKLLSKRLNIPYDLMSCQKVKNTLPQASLDSEQRRKNLIQSFQTIPLPYQHVTLVDDLLTTGSTANELARTLKQSGVKRVDIWCCARTVYD